MRIWTSTRTRLLHFATGSAVFATLVLLVGPASAIGQANSPNFIIINTDDMNAPEIAFMPEVQQLLVNEGITFTNAFITTPNCCPSRASFLRGQYTHNHGVLTNSPPDGGFQTFRDLGLENATIATWLQQSGYRTGLVGKYLNGYGLDDPFYIPPGWDEWFALNKGQGYYGYELNENGTVVGYGNNPEDYQTDVIAGHVLDFVGRVALDPRPFFLYVAPAAPHGPFTPAPRHLDEFPGIAAPRPPSFNEADVSDKPLWIQAHPLMSEETIARVDEDYRRRLQTLLAVDEMLSSIVAELERLGELANTYLFFTSDNGWHQGEHRLDLGKRQPYEESIRVPLVVRGPGVPKAITRDQFVLHIDLAPTLMFIVRGQIPPISDGRPLADLLSQNPLNRWRLQFLIEHAGDPKAPGFNAIRTPEYLYVDHFETGEQELYDMATDPFQIESIHGSAPVEVIEELAGQLDALVSCRNRGCRFSDH